MMTWIFLGILLALAVWFIAMYNNGISLKNYKNEAFATMDVYLKKRWDLIPNLIEATKGYAQHEEKLFTEVTELRTKNYSEMSESEKLDINNKLSLGLRSILAVAENYPELKASENFQQFSNELSNIESEIASSRKYYNGTVREFNNYLEYFPSNIVGMICGFQKGTFFEIDEPQRENVQVKF